MHNPSQTLDRFIRAVRRRWVIARAAEYMGACVLGGCAVALLLLPILLWRNESALPVVSMILLIGAGAGLIAGFVRRPDLMSAAAEADRQLDLADLLSTALATRTRSTADLWADVVLATANARCKNLSANDVILNRFGARTWGGIGLAGALVLTLTLMSANPRSSVAVVTPGSSSEASEAQPRDAAQGAKSRGGAQGRRDFAHSSASNSTQTPDDATAATPNQGNASRNTRSTASADGGAGMATSHAPNAPSPRVSTQAQSRDSGRGEASAGGRNVAPGSSHQQDAAASGSTVVSPQRVPDAPPWQSTSWPAARVEALSAVRDGRVADDYSDLVRAYFADRAE